MRPVERTEYYESLLDSERLQAKKVGFTGDAFSDDPAETSGPSAISSTLGQMHPSGYVNGSFNDTSSWTSVGDGARAAMAFLGHPEKGPALVFVHLEPGATGPDLDLDSEVLRVVMVGGGAADGDQLQIGSVRLYPGGSVPSAQGGETGLGELLLIGDRTALGDRIASAGPWGSALTEMLAIVRQGLLAVAG
jgi:hypothetical protein